MIMLVAPWRDSHHRPALRGQAPSHAPYFIISIAPPHSPVMQVLLLVLFFYN